MSSVIVKNARLKQEIIKSLYYKKNLALSDLCRITKKSLPSVTIAVSNLITEGYLVEQELSPSTGGRPPSTFTLNPLQKKYIIAIAMDQMITKISVYNLFGEEIKKTELFEFNIKDAPVSKFTDFISAYIDRSKVDKSEVLGIGIGMPGFVNAHLGVNNSYLIPQDGTNLKNHLEKIFNLPVFIDNDSSLIALAELNFGQAIGGKQVMVVNIGWGTGLGMIINGALYRGSSGYAGEFSHIPLSNSKNLCSCGKRGCLEVDTSLLVMAENARKALAEGAKSSMEELFKDDSIHQGDHFLEAALNYDPLAVDILSKAAFQLGKGLATLIHILNPESIVLSGKGAKAGKMLLPAIQQALNEFCIPRIAEQTIIKVSELNEQAELLAAASLVVENSQFES